MSQGVPVSGVIEDAKMSQSGKSLGLKVGGKWYSTKEFHWQSQIGQQVSFIGNYQSFGDGGVTWANDIVLSNAPGPNSMAPPPQPSAPSARAQGYSPPASYSGGGQQPASPAAMAYMPFVSNTVAHAIQAGVIKSPEEIYAWAQKAFDTAKNLVEGRQRVTAELPAHSDDFDDDIPF